MVSKLTGPWARNEFGQNFIKYGRISLTRLNNITTRKYVPSTPSILHLKALDQRRKGITTRLKKWMMMEFTLASMSTLTQRGNNATASSS